jgi:hypothetical protein
VRVDVRVAFVMALRRMPGEAVECAVLSGV